MAETQRLYPPRFCPAPSPGAQPLRTRLLLLPPPACPSPSRPVSLGPLITSVRLSSSLCVRLSLPFSLSLCQSPFSISVSISVTLTHTHTHSQEKSLRMSPPPHSAAFIPQSSKSLLCVHTASHSITYARPPCHTHNLRVTPPQIMPSQHTESHSQSLAEMPHMMLRTVS